MQIAAESLVLETIDRLEFLEIKLSEWLLRLGDRLELQPIQAGLIQADNGFRLQLIGTPS